MSRPRHRSPIASDPIVRERVRARLTIDPATGALADTSDGAQPASSLSLSLAGDRLRQKKLEAARRVASDLLTSRSGSRPSTGRRLQTPRLTPLSRASLRDYSDRSVIWEICRSEIQRFCEELDGALPETGALDHAHRNWQRGLFELGRVRQRGELTGLLRAAASQASDPYLQMEELGDAVRRESIALADRWRCLGGLRRQAVSAYATAFLDYTRGRRKSMDPPARFRGQLREDELEEIRVLVVYVICERAQSVQAELSWLGHRPGSSSSGACGSEQAEELASAVSGL